MSGEMESVARIFSGRSMQCRYEMYKYSVLTDGFWSVESSCWPPISERSRSGYRSLVS
jgi:hypothetical protein